MAAGFVLGFVVGAQVGPIWLLCARTTLHSGLLPGLAVGLGAACVDLCYACLGVAGAAGLLRVAGLRLGLGLAGAGVLVVMGGRTLMSAVRVRLGAESEVEVATPGAALRTSLAATASNPLTIASWGAVFTAASTARLTATAGGTAELLIGVGLGSLGWFTVLASGLRVVGRTLGERSLRVVDAVAGLGLVGFGGLLAVRTVQDL
jgi:threonine/homoserine/homoserine lactone efflux protein